MLAACAGLARIDVAAGIGSHLIDPRDRAAQVLDRQRIQTPVPPIQRGGQCTGGNRTDVEARRRFIGAHDVDESARRAFGLIPLRCIRQGCGVVENRRAGLAVQTQAIDVRTGKGGRGGVENRQFPQNPVRRQRVDRDISCRRQRPGGQDDQKYAAHAAGKTVTAAALFLSDRP